jgi:hypothetical protein
MLAEPELRRLGAGFAAFDHEWRLYAPMLGEPFLLRDAFLGYSDGEFAYICLLPLAGEPPVSSFDEIERLLDALPGSHQGVDLWGNFDLPPAALATRSGALSMVAFSDRAETSCEAILDLASFDERRDPVTARAIRAAERQGITAVVCRPPVLTHEHLTLLRRWRIERRIGPIQAEFALTSDRLIADACVWLIEVRRAGQLVGWAVVSMPSPAVMVYLLGFFETGGGSRASDATMAALLDFARRRDCSRVFLGYAPTPGLLAFKRKWGGRETGQNYREVFYSTERHRDAVLTCRFPWRQRLISSGGG